MEMWDGKGSLLEKGSGDQVWEYVGWLVLSEAPMG